jgi:hypothetical protein
MYPKEGCSKMSQAATANAKDERDNRVQAAEFPRFLV